MKVDSDKDALNAKGLSRSDISNAINAQNVTLPSGSLKVGDRDYTVSTNASPSTVSALNDLPVKVVNGAMVYIRDIGQVRDGSVVQQNTVRADSQPSVLLTIMKTGSGSTLDVVSGVQKPILAVHPPPPPPR